MDRVADDYPVVRDLLFCCRTGPLVRKHAHPVYIEKGIIREIAIGIDSTEEQQF